MMVEGKGKGRGSEGSRVPRKMNFSGRAVVYAEQCARRNGRLPTPSPPTPPLPPNG